jgi:hypothetical protein
MDNFIVSQGFFQKILKNIISNRKTESLICSSFYCQECTHNQSDPEDVELAEIYCFKEDKEFLASVYGL